jgi:hypothetical protein
VYLAATDVAFLGEPTRAPADTTEHDIADQVLAAPVSRPSVRLAP